MLLALERARSATAHAAAVAAGGETAELPVAASLAKACCSEAFVAVAESNIQLHGARGCTWDHDAHLYLKRAKSSELLFGDAAFHRARIADRLGL
jgi:alkylation response protein AidB-like acyl-CoA dehydrogenase